ncbi:MAG TPA: site-2 protease family protein [Opitutales bacterium]|nr:site-2 protease family protein [Opitutales bacterium]
MRTASTATTTPPPRKKTFWQKLMAPFVAVGAMIAKFWAVFKVPLLLMLKFGGPFLKTGGSMLLMIWIYARFYGWPWAEGFVILIFVHECGHLIVAKYFGLRVSAPMFIPFMGAFIALKEAPRNAWMEACVGIGGPVFGTLGACVCEIIYRSTGNELYGALANSGFFLNLFNLMPVGQMDGGRIVTALSPWLWIVGYLLMGIFMIKFPSLIVILMMLLGLPRLISLFRAKTPEQKRYYEIPAYQRFIMAVMYFGLILFLIAAMMSHIIPQAVSSA